MSPGRLLAAMRAAGLDVFPDGDRLRIRGDNATLARFAPAAKITKAELMALLWSETLGAHFEQRAAILEFDGGLSRSAAEANARASTGLLAHHAGLPWRALREAIGDPDLPDTLAAVDSLPYGLPQWCLSPSGRVIQQGVFRHNQGTR